MINPDTTITFFNGSVPSEIQDEILIHIPKELLNFAQVNKEANRMVHNLLEKNVSELKRNNLKSWNFWYKNDEIEGSNNSALNKIINSFSCLLKNCNVIKENSSWFFENLNMPPLEHGSLDDLVQAGLLDLITSSLDKTDKAALAVTCKTNQKIIKDIFKREMHIARRYQEHVAARMNQERFIINFETIGSVANFLPEDWERHFGVNVARNLQ